MPEVDMSSHYLVVFFAVISRTWSLQSFMMIPQDSEVKVGESLTLGCVVAEKGGVCSWEKDGVPIGHYDDKYIWNNKAGGSEDCSLTILDISPAYDAGVWVCQVSASNILVSDSLVSTGAMVSVIHPPAQVYIQNTDTGEIFTPGQKITVVEDEDLDLTCVAIGGHPAPALIWQSPLESLSQVSQVNVKLESGNWVASVQNLARVSIAGHNAFISCQAIHPSLSKSMESNIKLNVQHKPVIKDILIDQEFAAEVGDDITIICDVESNPELLEVYWYKASRPYQKLSTSPELHIQNISPNDIGAYICVAENRIGATERQFYLDFHYPAAIRRISPSGHIIMLLDSSLELSCDVEGNPLPEIWWEWQDITDTMVQQVVGHGSVLQLDNVNYNHTGGLFVTAYIYVPNELCLILFYITVNRLLLIINFIIIVLGAYTCRAENVEFNDGHMVTVEVRGGPTIINHSSKPITHLAQTADNVEFQLEFCSNPRTDKIQWMDGYGNILSESSATVSFSIIELTDSNSNVACYQASLILLNVQTSFNGIYKIKVENEFGVVSQEFHLTVENNFLNLEILLATISGFILTILLLLFIIISLCQRQRQRDAESVVSSQETDSETYSRDNSSEDLISNSNLEPKQPCLDSVSVESCPLRNSENFSTIYSFPRAANGGSLRKGALERKVYNDSAYIHINTNAYSYVSFDDVDKQISNVL